MLIEKSIEEFMEELKSKAATPGGGGVAALNSAMGTALIMMVANLTADNIKFADAERYPEWQSLSTEALGKLEPIRRELLEAVDEDAREFGKMAAAYGMPTATEAEKQLRSEAIAAAAVGAAETPLKVMKLSVQALEICRSLLGRSNPNLKSDLLVAALSLRAGALSAKCNVDINLPIIMKSDAPRSEKLRETAEALAESAKELAEKIR